MMNDADELIQEKLMDLTPEQKANEFIDSIAVLRPYTRVTKKAKQQLLSLIQEENNTVYNQAIDDIKLRGYGYDDGTGFVLKISFAELQALKQPKDGTK
jgi:hypothetical protein